MAKNIQVIDGAINCADSIFAAPDQMFDLIFPDEGQDVEFIDDFIKRVGERKAGQVLNAIWKNRLPKHTVNGIHGTLFYELDAKRKFYPTKRESDLDANRSR